MPENYKKIEKPFAIDLTKKIYEEYIETFGLYAAPNRNAINAAMMRFCPSEALVDKYKEFIPQLNKQFAGDWKYLTVFIWPAIEENMRSLEYLRMHPIKEWPTHNAVRRMISTMKDIIMELEKWIDSNGPDQWRFCHSAKFRLEELKDAFFPFSVAFRDELTKRTIRLYFKIHWDALNKAIEPLRTWRLTNLDDLWEYGIQDYLNHRDKPERKECNMAKCTACNIELNIDELKPSPEAPEFRYCASCYQFLYTLPFMQGRYS